MRDALYGGKLQMPPVTALDAAGLQLLPAHGTIDADAIARAVGTCLLAREEIASVRARLEAIEAAARPAADSRAARTPFFCSGCPHNSSTVAPEGEISFGAGIGCHRCRGRPGRRHGAVTGITQMGGEGAADRRRAPFASVPHFTQNLGDGTFRTTRARWRSAPLSPPGSTSPTSYLQRHRGDRRQDVEGGWGAAEAARSLKAEGVSRIVVTTEEPERYRAARRCRRSPRSAAATSCCAPSA
ncbi:MAG: hypothetical protein U0R71_01695 [Solirubrobacterales bacterium]